MADSQVLDLPPRNTNVPVTPINTHPHPTQQIPLTYKAATQSEHSMNVPLSDEAYEKISKETRGHYFVGMEPQKFLDEFLPFNTATPDTYKKQTADPVRINNLKTVPPQSGQKESHMYAPFVKALDGWATGTDHGQKLRFGHFPKPDITCASLSVDISTYWEHEFPEETTPQGPVLGSCTFAQQQMHEEFKSGLLYDAFAHEFDEGPKTSAITEEDEQTAAAAQGTSDKTSGASPQVKDATPNTKPNKKGKQGQPGAPSLIATVEPDNQRGNKTRGQIAAYAGVAMSMAFRKHFFSMLILGEYARIIRWDRRGAIVTRRFSYTKRPELVFEFYLRFAQLSPSQRGFDVSVVPLNAALPAHVGKAFDSYYQESWYQGAKYGHKDNSPRIPAANLPFFHIHIEDRTFRRAETFFMPAPAYRHSHMQPFNRASRRSLVYPDAPGEQKMCFLKDSWQEVSKRTSPEADIYRKLQANNVPNIAALRLGDDVVVLKTETEKKFNLLSHSGRYRKFGAMVCHRIVLDTVARDLSTFTWCKVLLSCLADAVDAAQQAYKAGVLHRDISAGNIMIVRNEQTNEWRGVLINWDMCLLLEQRDNHSEIRTARTGTWAFISSRLLAPATETPVIHSLADDMESVFWVLSYQLLRYTAHDNLAMQLYEKMHYIFDDATERDAERVGGGAKQNTLHSCNGGVNRLKSALASFKVVGLIPALRKLAKVFDARYDDDDDNDKVALADLDSPEDKWLSKSLREAALNLAPLNVTPTALISPTHNSEPPTNRSKWAPATISTAKVDYFAMPFSKNEHDSLRAQSDYFKTLTKSMPFNVDGLSYQSTKRYRDDDDSGVTEDPMQAKKPRPSS